MGHGARYLALLEGALERWDDAARLNDYALAAHERMGALPWLAFTHLDRARLLLARPARGRTRSLARAQAAQSLSKALALARRLDMAGLERQIAAVGSDAASPPQRAGTRPDGLLRS
jgi:hypothetical protein